MLRIHIWKSLQPVTTLRVAVIAAIITGFAPATLAVESEAPVVAEANTSVVAGSEAPFQDLLTLGGDPAAVDEHFNNGKWTLVMLWATNCHVCKEQKPMISAAHNERKDHDFTVMGIAIDGSQGLDSVNRYIDKYTPSFPNFVGELTSVAFNYELLTEDGFRGTPTYLLFNPENELIASQPGKISKEALFEFIAKNS